MENFETFFEGKNKLNSVQSYLTGEPLRYEWQNSPIKTGSLPGVIASRRIETKDIDFNCHIFEVWKRKIESATVSAQSSYRITIAYPVILWLFLSPTTADVKTYLDTPFFIISHKEAYINKQNEWIEDPRAGSPSGLATYLKDISTHFEIYNYFISLETDNDIERKVKTLEKYVEVRSQDDFNVKHLIAFLKYYYNLDMSNRDWAQIM
jgi:hypothetical protein